MEAVICLSIFVVVTTIWAIYKTKNRGRKNQDDRLDAFCSFSRLPSPQLRVAF